MRFLNEVGGGKVTGFQGKDIVLVEDADGFDIPMPVRECVVIETDDYNFRCRRRIRLRRAKRTKGRLPVPLPPLHRCRLPRCPNLRYRCTASRDERGRCAQC